MSELPGHLTSSGLWQRLSENADLAQAIKHLRTITETVGNKISETIPEFTDHSVVHFDSLWSVCDQVFTPIELNKFSIGEAFILAATFYIHDLGMALGATEEGRSQLEATPAYKRCFDRLARSRELGEAEIKTISLRVSARETHAQRAESLIEKSLPGLDRFLIESKDVRDLWGDHIGKVAASHHWSLGEVDAQLGTRNRLPDPLGGFIDLGFLACALRIIDYAHINAGRASSLERVLRARISDDSIVHWYAQERISGPRREADRLVYASMHPIRDVDAWWIFYEMATGLDREIIAVGDYLSARAASVQRFSLEGVKGVRSPHTFSSLVRTDGFVPVDIRFRSDSMSRLVGILGGRTLYGNDQFAAVRELMQNAADAIHLRQATERTAGQGTTPGEIVVHLQPGEGEGVLSFADNGVGMSEKVVTTYLLGIATDYWNSPDFAAEYPSAGGADFRPVGRFGIGFLSVFMIGDNVEVQTQQANGPNLNLKLRGVGRRGSLAVRPSGLRTGTTVRVSVPPGRLLNYEGLARIVQAKAPMLDIRVKVLEGDRTAYVDPNWWQLASQEELVDFLTIQELVASKPGREWKRGRRDHSRPVRELLEDDLHFSRANLQEMPRLNKWPGAQPEVVSDTSRIIALPKVGTVVLCSKGFAIATVHLNGVTGIADVGEVELNAARSAPIGFDSASFRSQLLNHLGSGLES